MIDKELVAIIIGILIVGLVVGLIGYVVMGLSLYKAAKVEGINNKWLAWVPILNITLLFKLGDKSKYLWLYLSVILASFINIRTDSLIIAIIIIALSIWLLIIQIQVYINISKKYNMSSAWFIVSLFIPFLNIVAYIIFYNKISRYEQVKSSYINPIK